MPNQKKSLLRGRTLLMPLLSMTALCASAPGATLSPPNIICYRVSAPLPDGAIFSGSFNLDLHASPDDFGFGRISYPVLDHNITITNTLLLGAGGSSGTITELNLLQDTPRQRQELYFSVVNDAGSAGAFGLMVFSPFDGDGSSLMPIEGAYSFGYLDGAGQLDFESVTLTRIPEPSPLLLSILSGIAITTRRSRSK